MNRLREALERVDLDELEAEAETIGRDAVQKALAAPDLAAETQRQRDLDAALADAIEVVARHRARLGRRICSRHDGEQVRRIFELLRGLMDAGGDADPSFQ